MVSPQTREQIYKEYKNGRSVKKLAIKYKLNHSDIIRALILRRATFRRETYKLTNEEKKRLVIYMIRYYYEIEDIVRVLSVSRRFIQKAVIEKGYKNLKYILSKKRKKKESKYFDWEEYRKHPLAYYNK